MRIIQKMRCSVSLLRLRECGSGSSKAYTDPPMCDKLARVKLDVTLRPATRDVAHCSPQMTRSARLTTAMTHISTIDSDTGLFRLPQFGLLFNSGVRRPMRKL